MKAIKLIPENFETITKEIPQLSVDDLTEMYEGRLLLNEPKSYIIQDFVAKTGKWESPWANVIDVYFDQAFEWTDQELDHQFAEVTHI